MRRNSKLPSQEYIRDRIEDVASSVLQERVEDEEGNSYSLDFKKDVFVLYIDRLKANVIQTEIKIIMMNFNKKFEGKASIEWLMGLYEHFLYFYISGDILRRMGGIRRDNGIMYDLKKKGINTEDLQLLDNTNLDNIILIEAHKCLNPTKKEIKETARFLEKKNG